MQPELPEKLKLHTVSGIPLFNGKGPGHKQHINDVFDYTQRTFFRHLHAMQRTDCLGHMTTIIISYSTVYGLMWCTVSPPVPLTHANHSQYLCQSQSQILKEQRGDRSEGAGRKSDLYR